MKEQKIKYSFFLKKWFLYIFALKLPFFFMDSFIWKKDWIYGWKKQTNKLRRGVKSNSITLVTFDLFVFLQKNRKTLYYRPNKKKSENQETISNWFSCCFPSFLFRGKLFSPKNVNPFRWLIKSTNKHMYFYLPQKLAKFYAIKENLWTRKKKKKNKESGT